MFCFRPEEPYCMAYEEVEEPEEEDFGCCYDYGFGSGGEGWHGLHDVHNGELESMVGESQCPVEQRMGGGTRFASGSCLEIEALAQKETEETDSSEPELPTEEPRICCRGFTIECVSCTLGFEADEFCDNMPQHELCAEEEEICCEAMTVDCLACKAGVDPETYCTMAAFSWTDVCQDDNTNEEPEVMGCCYEYQMHSGGAERYSMHVLHEDILDSSVSSKDCPVAERLGGATRFVEGTCADVEVLASEEPDSSEPELPTEEPRICCRGFTIECVSCTLGFEPDEFCDNMPQHELCAEEEEICCEAMTVDCLACKAGVDPETYCTMAAFSWSDACQDDNTNEEPVEPLCPEVMCFMFCEDGFVKDEDGCETCECNERIDPVNCPICDACPEGMTGTDEVDENGCLACGCVNEEEEEPSCADDGMCCPVGYTCMRPRGGRPGEMQCVGIADGTAAAMECEEPCLIVDCLPGCDLVGSDENGCGGTCECEAPPRCPEVM